jgi:hypothetical protein
MVGSVTSRFSLCANTKNAGTVLCFVRARSPRAFFEVYVEGRRLITASFGRVTIPLDPNMVRGKRNELADETVRELVALRGLLTPYQAGRKYGIAATRVAGYWNAAEDDEVGGDASGGEQPHVSGKLAAVGSSKAGRKAQGIRESKNFIVQTGALQAAKIGKQESYSVSGSGSEACDEPHQSALADSLDVLLASIDAQGGVNEAAPTDTRQALRIAKKMRDSGELSAREHTDIVASLKTYVEPKRTTPRLARQPDRGEPYYEPEPEPSRAGLLARRGQHADPGGSYGSGRGRGGSPGVGRTSGGGYSSRRGDGLPGGGRSRQNAVPRAARWSASSSGSYGPELSRGEPHRRTLVAREAVRVEDPAELIGASIMRARVRF